MQVAQASFSVVMLDISVFCAGQVWKTVYILYVQIVRSSEM